MKNDLYLKNSEEVIRFLNWLKNKKETNIIKSIKIHTLELDEIYTNNNFLVGSYTDEEFKWLKENCKSDIAVIKNTKKPRYNKERNFKEQEKKQPKININHLIEERRRKDTKDEY